MPVFTVPINGANGPGSVTVNATDATSAAQNVGAGNTATGPATAGGPSASTSVGPTTGGAAPAAPAATVNSAASAQLASGVNSLLGAIASGNKQAFDEAVRQFNATFGLDQSKFQESIRQFNESLGITQAGLTGTYQGQQTQQAALQAQNIAAQNAGLTGYYQAPGTAGGTAAAPGTVVRDPTSNQTGIVTADGKVHIFTGWDDAAQYGYHPGGPAPTTLAPGGIAAMNAGMQPGVATLAAQNQWANLYGTNAPPTAGQTTLAAQQQAYAQQMGVINAAAALQANPFRQAQVMGQAGRVLAGMPTAGFQAPNIVQGVGTAGGNTQGGLGYLNQMVGDINAGGYQQVAPGQLQAQQQQAGMSMNQAPSGGMGSMSQLISDIQSPQSNAYSPQQFLDQTPTPNKIDSQGFLRSTPGTQNLILQAMNEKYGIDPNDALAQIKQTLPQFTAPSTLTGTVRRG
jgi:hypothetical protein